MEKITKEIFKKLENIPLNYKVLKLMEETGELAQALIVLKDIENKSYNKNFHPEDLLEEALDVLLVIKDIIFRIQEEYKISDAELNKILTKKIEKAKKNLIVNKFYDLVALYILIEQECNVKINKRR